VVSANLKSKPTPLDGGMIGNSHSIKEPTNSPHRPNSFLEKHAFQENKTSNTPSRANLIDIQQSVVADENSHPSGLESTPQTPSAA
jgi:hypothetical protein